MKEKYIDERFPPWHLVPGGRLTHHKTIVLVDNGNAAYFGVSMDDAENLVAEHNRALDMLKKLVEIAECYAPEVLNELWYGDEE